MDRHTFDTVRSMAGDHVFHAADVDVAPERVRDLSGEIQLVDVREPYEWEAGRLAGARHVELERLASKAPTIDRERPVVFYCRLGARSGMAANAFRRAGYDAYSMVGGIAAWHERGLPIEPDDGYVAEH
jgi:hydroxyacylglutathione hydrolase/adenylyltransferase/sulfurtransferase